MRILVVSNNPSDKELVNYMDRRGFQTECMSGLGDVSWYFVRAEPNLVIIDLAHDNPEHLRLLDELKSRANTPVIAIIEREPIEFDCATALELGADDCLARPFGARELVARTRAILRRLPIKRAIRSPAQSGSYWFAGWRLKLGSRRLTNSKGMSVALTAAEYILLIAFLDAPRRTLTRQFLVQATHLHQDIAERSIDVQVMRLRQKLATDRNMQDLIKAAPGLGYVFAAPVEKLGSEGGRYRLPSREPCHAAFSILSRRSRQTGSVFAEMTLKLRDATQIRVSRRLPG